METYLFLVTLSILYSSKLLFLSCVSMLSLCSQYSRLQPCSKFILGHMHLYLGKSGVKHYNMMLFLPVDLKKKRLPSLGHEASSERDPHSGLPLCKEREQRPAVHASSEVTHRKLFGFGHVPMTFPLYSMWTCSYGLHILQ